MGRTEQELLAWAKQVEQTREASQDETFQLLQENLFYLRACTSLSDEDATARANAVPSGTSHGWQLCTDEDQLPVPCQDKLGFRHLMWEC